MTMTTWETGMTVYVNPKILAELHAESRASIRITPQTPGVLHAIVDDDDIEFTHGVSFFGETDELLWLAPGELETAPVPLAPVETEAAPKSRYHVTESLSGSWFVRDREDDGIVKEYDTREAAEVRANELNGLQAPVVQVAKQRYYAKVSSDSGIYHIYDRHQCHSDGSDVVIYTLAGLDKTQRYLKRLNACEPIELETPAAPVVTPHVHPAVAMLAALNVDALSPLEALTKLYELKRLVVEG